MTSRMGSFLPALSIALLVGGCASFGGLSTQASLRQANALASGQSLAAAAISPAGWPATDWWKSYGDAQLDQLIEEALSGSPTLKIAEARTRKALALVHSDEAALLPRLNADAEATRERFSARGLIPPPFGGTWGTLLQLQTTLSWELDLWGRNKSALQSASGAAKAAQIDVYAARLALSTSIAQAYAALSHAYLQLDVADETLRAREQVYALTRDRSTAGLDSRFVLKQAESALPATREQVAQLEENMGLIRNQLAALLGQGPDRGQEIKRPNPITVAQPALPATLPADLLSRRPDLAAERARVETAQADIATAKAQFYPDVNLMAFVGLQSLGGAGFFSWNNRTLGAGPAVNLPLFDGGRLRANLAGKDADYDIAVEQYNQSLADAMRDVVDQLTSFHSIEQQQRLQAQALATTREAYDLALLRYREGLGNYLEVLSAEAPWLLQRGLDADLRSRRLTLAINLVRALGGGFDPATLAPAVTHG